jgi:hypothetical protein
MVKTGRNAPCPCGSGKKYKKCHGGVTTMTPSLEAALEAMYRESQEIEEQSFRQISENLEELVRDLRSYDQLSTLTVVAALALVDENRNHIIRLDALLHLGAIHAHGKREVTVNTLDRWLNQFLSRSTLSRREDPAEDVAVGNVMTRSGNRRIFTGNWSNPDYYLQDVLDALDKGPGSVEFIRAECDSVLKISDLLAVRKGYARLTGKSESESSAVWLPSSDEALKFLSRQALIDSNDLSTLQIAADAIRAFAVPFDEFCAGAPEVAVVATRRKPLITLGDLTIVAHPTEISMAIISHALSSTRNLGLLGGLENSLRRIQGMRTLPRSADGVTGSDFLTSLLPKEGSPSPYYVSQTAFRFDRNKYLHLLFFHDNVDEIERDSPASNWHPPFRDSFGKFIEKSSKKLLDEGACIGGLTLIVIGGVWRGCAMAMPQKLPPKCGFQIWSSADLDRLMENERRWKLLLWKLSMQRRTLEELGISLEAHSDANLYSMWTHHDYRLIPHDANIDSLDHVGFGAEFIFNMRLDNRSGTDDHCIYRPDRAKWERVRKLHSRAHFKEDAARKTYGALSPPSREVLEGAVDTMKRSWWVDCSTMLSDSAQRRLVYDIWETAVNWVERISPKLDEFIPELGAENVVFSLDISEIAEHEDWTIKGLRGIPAVTSLLIKSTGRVASIRLPIAFVAMAYSPKNEAERLLVKALVSSALAVAGVSNDDERAVKIIHSLALSDDDRFMHLFVARDARDYLHVFYI